MSNAIPAINENENKFHDDITNSSDNNQQQFLNILSNKFTKINEKFIFKFTKESSSVVDREARRTCKIANFSSDFKFEELQSNLKNLNPDDHPHLFIFIINLKNAGFYKTNQNSESTKKKNKFIKTVEKVTKALCNFSETRPLVLQLTSEEENVTKIYYKEQNSSKFSCINQQDSKFRKFLNFPTFLCSFLAGSENIEHFVVENLSQINNSSLILRFLRTFQLSNEVFHRLVLASATFGSNNVLLAAIDAQFEGNGRILSDEAQKYLHELIKEYNLKTDSPNEQKESPEGDASTFLSESDENDSNDNVEVSSVSPSDHSSQSVLLTAIEHENIEVIDYLITYWTHLIQELPFDHQVRISTAAFKTNQLDVFCDLLEIADFPFPEDYEFDDEQEHERLRKITLQRMGFTNAIKRENFKKIDQFIDNNLSLKYAFGIDNETALTQAIELKKFGVFYYLKSLGFQGENFEEILNGLNKDEKEEATQQAVKQRKTNVKLALINVDKSVLLLATRSLMHNRKISKEQETECRQKIINWFQDIHKIAPEMLDVAVSCEHLKIIFDFESDTVSYLKIKIPVQ